MDPLAIAAPIFLFLLGTVIGSFLNVVIYRLPRGESLNHPRSHCPRCGRTLQPADLVPLLSWLLLKGRCRSCGTRISARYFGVELLTGLLFVGCWFAAPYSLFSSSPDGGRQLANLVHDLVMVVLFVPIIFIDLDHQVVPDELSVPLLLVGFAWNIVSGLTGQPWLVSVATHKAADVQNISIPTSILFSIACAGVFWMIRWMGEVVFRKEAMGLGDVNIAAGIGANFLLLDAFCSFGIAIGVGAIVGILLIVVGKRHRAESALAFGPMLLTGALFVMLLPGPIHALVTSYRATLG